MEDKEVVYLLLKKQYLKSQLKKGDFTVEEIVDNDFDLFPIDWELLDLEHKIEMIAKAIKENKSLTEIYEKELEEDQYPQKLG